MVGAHGTVSPSPNSSAMRSAIWLSKFLMPKILSSTLPKAWSRLIFARPARREGIDAKRAASLRLARLTAHLGVQISRTKAILVRFYAVM